MSATRSPWSLVPIVAAVVVTWLLLHRVVFELYATVTEALTRVVPAGPFA